MVRLPVRDADVTRATPRTSRDNRPITEPQQSGYWLYVCIVGALVACAWLVSLLEGIWVAYGR